MGPFNPYFPNNYQNIYQNHMAPQMNRFSNPDNQYQWYQNQPYQNQNINNVQPQIPQVLPGMMVDSVKVVDAMLVPLDGSITYFPKTDGTEIYTKRIQENGESRVDIYKLTPSSSGTQPVLDSNGVNREDIEKIYSDISEVKKSLESNLEAIHSEMNNILNRFDELKDGIITPNGKNSSLNNKVKGVK